MGFVPAVQDQKEFTEVIEKEEAIDIVSISTKRYYYKIINNCNYMLLKKLNDY